MALIRDIQTGDRISVSGNVGTVETIVHYGGAYDVRIALRNGSRIVWQPANYTDSCKRLRATQRSATPNLRDDIRYPY